MENIGYLDRKTTKGQIIHILTEDYPLTSKEIYAKLKGSYSFQGTYQGTHKALQELVQNSVVQQEDLKYSLKHEWLTQAHEHIEGLKNRLIYKNPSIEEITSKETITIEFEKFIDIGRFVLEKFGNLPDHENKEFITLVNHAWPAIALSKEMFKLFKEFHKKNQNYILVGNDTIIDKMNVKPFIQNGAKVKFVKNIEYPDKLIKGDYIMYAYFDHKGRTIYDQFCKATRNLGSLNLHTLFSTLFETSFKHKIIIVHNKDLAEQMRKQTLKKFGNVTKNGKTN